MPRRSKAVPKDRAPLTRERVLRAALELADESGIESLSMRKLGQRLGVEAMSLYRHVANKDDVVDGIVDLVASEFEPPPPGSDWKAAMRQRAVAAHRALMRHPWATLLILSRVNVGPAMLRYVDATIGCLRAAGFSYAEADHAWNALDSHVYGFTLQILNFPCDPREYAATAKEYLPRIPAEKYPHLRAMSVEVAEGRHDGLNRLDFGLDLLLDGLERMVLAGDRSGLGVR
jgi:AcrR family transcriptional regulator